MMIDMDKKYVTIEGRTKVRIICTDRPGPYPIVGILEDNTIEAWTAEGKFYKDRPYSNSDLVEINRIDLCVGSKYVDKVGNVVRVVCTNRANADRPILTVSDVDGSIRSYEQDGTGYLDSRFDLVGVVTDTISMDKKYTDRAGNPVVIHSIDKDRTSAYPVQAKTTLGYRYYTREGNYYMDEESRHDLVEVKE